MQIFLISYDFKNLGQIYLTYENWENDENNIRAKCLQSNWKWTKSVYEQSLCIHEIQKYSICKCTRLVSH